MLGRVSPPPSAQLPSPGAPHAATPPFGASVPGAPTPQIAPAAQPEPQKKSYLPLIIALNVVVLLAIVVVLVFVLKH